MIVKRTEPAEQAYWDTVVVPRLNGDVEVLDQPTHDVKVDVVGRARAMLFPIDWPEPFGLVMTEAMAYGTPVIARPLGAVPEVVTHGKTGYLCSTVEQIVDAVEMTEALRPEDCRSQVEERFSTGTMVAGYERVYEAAVGELLDPLQGRGRHAARVRGPGDGTMHDSARQAVRPGGRTHRAANEKGPRWAAP
jgi:glycosyltransferase involved in cell wall biosynthesis